MSAHRHQALAGRTVTRCFTGPVSRHENPAAHGGVTLVHYCACGATRRTNQNGRHIERGPWQEPDPSEGQPVARLRLVKRAVTATDDDYGPCNVIETDYLDPDEDGGSR